MKSTSVVFTNSLPEASGWADSSLVIYDEQLLKFPHIRRWLKGFRCRLEVKAGEELKTFSSLQKVLSQIQKFPHAHDSQMTFVAVGGGSVGDFVGFLASIYKRGRNLVHIPTTWLAAVDSSHGGKTALNFEKTKNQLGSFWPATEIIISQPLLETQPAERATEALAEIFKMGLINQPELVRYIQQQTGPFDLWPLLPTAIQGKYKIVEKDPFETVGPRRLLNLGHTMGHVFESELKWSHGKSVAAGLYFALLFSQKKEFLKAKVATEILFGLDKILSLREYQKALSKLKPSVVNEKLMKDKKRLKNSEIDFIFVKKAGSCLRSKVAIADILKEVKRQQALKHV